MNTSNQPTWGIVVGPNKWYRVARMIFADGNWYELCWHADTSLQTKSKTETRKRALYAGLVLHPGIFRDAPSPRHGSVMTWEES